MKGESARYSQNSLWNNKTGMKSTQCCWSLSLLYLHPDLSFLGCMEALNDSFGHLNITYNNNFSPDCMWVLGNSGITEPVAIVSIEEVQLGFCRYVFVWDVALAPVIYLVTNRLVAMWYAAMNLFI